MAESLAPPPLPANVAAVRPGYFQGRTALARKFIEPNYDTINGINVAEIRGLFQNTLTTLAEAMDVVIKRAGVDLEWGVPQDPQFASIHHTAFCDSMDLAKDHLIKYVLACAATKKESTGEREREDIKTTV
jgi:hypothetical protein